MSEKFHHIGLRYIGRLGGLHNLEVLFCVVYIGIWRLLETNRFTGCSLSEVLILSSIKPKHDKRLLGITCSVSVVYIKLFCTLRLHTQKFKTILCIFNMLPAYILSCKSARQCYAIFWLNWLVNKYIWRFLTYKYWKSSRNEVNHIGKPTFWNLRNLEVSSNLRKWRI